MFKRAVIAVATLVLTATIVPGVAASAAPKAPPGPLTLAVYGDSPYGVTAYAPGNQADNSWQRQKSPDFITTINNDPSVSEVIHVGDIHSGKQFCTEAYNTDIATLWQSFEKPLVYTPGDNEWADCHKATNAASPGEGGGIYSSTSHTISYVGPSGMTTDTTACVDSHCGNPLDNLALVRQDFFPQAGHTLGSDSLQVVSQATAFNPNFPTDAQYVENVMWAQRDIVFVTINVPGGSNNDADPWYKVPSATQAQADERTNRTDADIRWLDAAFALATEQHAKGVVITAQADMWDLDGKAPSHLSNYESIIREIAAQTTAFGRPVLMFNGDSHLYRSDNPMSQTAPCIGETDPATGASVCAHDANNNAWYEHQSMNLDVPNFHRVVVHGSGYDPGPPTNTVLPLEWLKLTVDPNADFKTTDTTFGPFSWQRQPQPQLLP
jgi:hypothetical protein